MSGGGSLLDPQPQPKAGLAFPLVRLVIGALVLLGLKEIAVQIPLLREMAAPWPLASGLPPGIV